METSASIKFNPTAGRTGVATWICGFVAGLIAVTSCAPAWALMSDSPEVESLSDSGLAAIDKQGNELDDFYAARLGGRCAVGIAFVKAGKPEHARVDEAVEAVRAAMTSGEKIDVYSNGIVVVFLCELSPKNYSREIQWYL